MHFKRGQASEKKSGLFVDGHVRSFVSDGLGGIDLKGISAGNEGDDRVFITGFDEQ